jgi:hydrogenase expression/formation protein HypE
VSDQRLPIGKLPGALLSSMLAKRTCADPSVIVGPAVGVDAAAIAVGGEILVVKTDPITFAVDRAPHYLVNVNANDIACLGAKPRWLLVTALLPAGSTTQESVGQMFDELMTACVERNIELVGGHTEITAGLDRPILVGQMLGTATPERLLKPGRAKPADRLLITQTIAIEGTAMLAHELADALTPALGHDLIARAAALLDDPGISVVDDARILLDTGWVTALHDPTEGGLATGVREIAAASGTGAFISETAIPVRPETLAIARQLGLNPLGMLASGTLLAAIDPAGMADVEAACVANGVPFAWIGKLAASDKGVRIRTSEGERELHIFDTDEASRALNERRGVNP